MVAVTPVLALEALDGVRGVARYGLKQIIELVGDAAGQLPDQLHLLCVAQLFLFLAKEFGCPMAFRDIAEAPYAARFPAVAH